MSNGRVETEEPGNPADRVPDRAMSHPWVGLVGNRAAGRGKASRKVDQLADALHDRGLAFRPVWTLDERQTLIAEANADSGCRAIVAAGGDGTVSAVIQERPQVPLAVLPAGTENLFAQHAALGRKPEAIARAIAAHQSRAIDLGQVVGGPRFSLMTGFGFDGDIVSRHHRARVGGLGQIRPTNRAAYVEPIVRASFFYRFPPIEVTILDEGREEVLTGTSVLLFNLPRYALGLPFAPSALDDDGALDLVIFKKPGAFHALRYLWLVFRGLHLQRRGVQHRAVKRISVAVHESPVPVQIDGDPGGVLELGQPWTLEVLPGALPLVVP